MKITFNVQTGPYTFQNIDTVYELAKRALDRGHEVAIFLYVDSVGAMSVNTSTPGDRNIPQRLSELAEKGAFIRGCGACAKYRGYKRDEMVEGTRLAGTAVLGEMIATSDRFINFGFDL
jgi:tRNA 2-thiouridine synthesizing protein D